MWVVEIRTILRFVLVVLLGAARLEGATSLTVTWDAVPEDETNSPTRTFTVLRLGLRIVPTANHANAAASPPADSIGKIRAENAPAVASASARSHQ